MKEFILQGRESTSRSFLISHPHHEANAMMDGREPTRYIRADAMEHFVGHHGMQIVRQTMLKQEAIFKEQLRELHRLYNVHKLLMDEIKRPPVSNRDRSVKFSANFVPIALGGVGQPKDYSSLKLKPGYDKELQDCAREDAINRKTHMDVLEKPATNMKDVIQKSMKRTFDLERLPEEYLDDEVHEETSTLKYNMNGQKTESNKEELYDSMVFLSLKTSSTEETNSTVTTSPSQRNSIKLDAELQSASKRSRCIEEECFPDQCLKPLASSQKTFLRAISGAKLEKSSDQEDRSSWNFDDACFDGSRKKGRASFNINTEDSPQEIRRTNMESQGSLNRARSGLQTFIQDVHKHRAPSHLPTESALPGGSFLEGRQAGQPWWKSFQTPKELGMHSSGGMLGYFDTAASSKTEAQIPLNAPSYGTHSFQGKLDSDSAHKAAVPFQSWRESELAACRLSTGIYVQGQGVKVSSGSCSDATISNSQGQISRSVDSGVSSACGVGSPQEAINGLWYQPMTDLPQFPQLPQHQSTAVPQTHPTSSHMQGTWQRTGPVGSNGMYSSLSAFLSKPREPASLEFHAADGVRKSTEDLGINFWLTASGGSRFTTASVSPPQLPAFSKPPKLVLDGTTMELKLASSDIIQDEEVVQTKAPGSLQEELLDIVPKDMQGTSTNFTGQNVVDQCCDLGCREALAVRTNASDLRSCKECGGHVSKTENHSGRHAGNGLSKEPDQWIKKELCAESNAMKSYSINAGLNLELRSRSLLTTGMSNVVSVLASYEENLPSKIAMSVSENISTSKNDYTTDEGAGLSTESLLHELSENLSKVQSKDLNFLKILRMDKQVLAAANVELLADVKQADSHCGENSVERDDKVNTNAVIVNSTNEDGDHFESEISRPLVSGEMLATIENPADFANPIILTREEGNHKEALKTLGSMFREVVKETKLLQGVEISSLHADAKQQALDVVEEQGIKAAENHILLESSIATEKLNKPQACATLEDLTIQENLNGCKFSHSQCQGDSMLLNFAESLNPTRPEEDMAAGSTLTTLGESSLSRKTGDPPNVFEDGSMQSPGLDLVDPAENFKLVEVSEDQRISVPTNVSHSSTLTSTTPTEAMSLLHESSTNGAGNSDPDGRISLMPKHEYTPEKSFSTNKLSPEETNECDQYLSLDESVNLAASILVSLLPNASLPPKSFEKERACSALLKSSSSSADHMVQLGNDQGKCGNYNSRQEIFSFPLVVLKDNSLCCTLQTPSLEQVAITESEKKFVQRQSPDFDLSSFNMKGHNNAIHEEQHEEHGTNHLDSSFSQKIAGASTTKKKNLRKKCYRSNTLPSVFCLEAPELRLGDALDGENLHNNKDLVRHGSVTGSASYTTFEGEDSNQVTGQQAAKTVGFEKSDENFWSPTNSQQVDSEDETSKMPSGDTIFCIRNWGDSTRKRRMQRHKNTALHKRQKCHRISLSKLQH